MSAQERKRPHFIHNGTATVACVVCLAAAGIAGPASTAQQTQTPVRNVIVMIADGAGFNAFAAASMYEGTLGQEVYDGAGWVQLAASVHSLRRGASPAVTAGQANVQFPNRVYDPAKAWDSTRLESAVRTNAATLQFEGYRWLVRSSPDSASTASAIASGHKSYDGAINVDGAGRPIERTLADIARKGGRRVGVVTSVPLSHATPAALAGAHNKSRSNYCEIAVEMLVGGRLDVLAGAGNPDFDNNGQPVSDPARRIHQYVGGPEVWAALTGRGTLDPGSTVCAPTGSSAAAETDDHDSAAEQRGTQLSGDQISRLDQWVLKQSRADIAALRRGPTPDRLLLVPQVGSVGFWPGRSSDPADPFPVRRGSTLQQHRGSRADPRWTSPGFDPPNAGVPSLGTLTEVALNALDADADGFLLHVEGGAVDWAMHANQAGRMIEELMDFKAAIRAVVAWVDAADAWDETLLIVTADHDHMLWGPNSESVPFDPLQDRGAGNMPGYAWLSNGHSNALVPVYARGAGVTALVEAADRDDPFRGAYLDQTEIFTVLAGALSGE